MKEIYRNCALKIINYFTYHEKEVIIHSIIIINDIT